MFLRLFEIFVKFPSIQPFLTGNKALFPSLSPSGKVARSADRGLFKISPYVAPSPCLHKILPYVKASPCFFLLSQKSAKIVSRYAASPRGEAPPRGGGEGRNLFSVATFSLAFPFREPLSNCRFKAISASRAASDSEPREVSPFLKQSPL